MSDKPIPSPDPAIVDEVGSWLDEIALLRGSTLFALLDDRAAGVEQRFEAVCSLMHAARGLEMELHRYVYGSPNVPWNEPGKDEAESGVTIPTQSTNGAMSNDNPPDPEEHWRELGSITRYLARPRDELADLLEDYQQAAEEHEGEFDDLLREAEAFLLDTDLLDPDREVPFVEEEAPRRQRRAAR